MWARAFPKLCRSSPLTWLVCYSRGEEESLLGGSSCCQGPLVMWKNWDHERRHVPLNLLNRREPVIRQGADVAKKHLFSTAGGALVPAQPPTSNPFQI